jgi:hypothetical protein
MHLVFIDEHRRERDALLTCIHGDPLGRQITGTKKDEDGNNLIIDGVVQFEYGEPGENWPCINLVVISDNENAQDQYGRQVDDRYTSIVHMGDSTAIGYCYRFADETVDWSKVQPSVS